MARPTKYKTIFNEWLIEHFANGGEFQTFPGLIYHKSKGLPEFKGPILVSERTLYDWLNPKSASYQDEFLQTKKDYSCLREYYWKDLAIKDISINPTKWIFTMKNVFGWKDNPTIQVDTSVNLHTPKLDAWFDNLVNEEIEKRAIFDKYKKL